MDTNRTKGTIFKFSYVMATASLATTLFLSFGISLSSPVYAAPGDCSTASPMGATGVKTVKSVERNGQVIELRTGYLGRFQYGWARIANPKRGDMVWMDFSQDGGFTWKQCGPYNADRRQFSEAVTTSSDSNRRFRACGTTPGAATQCTPWF